MKGRIKRRVANVLIAIGALLLVICIGYEAINFPWRVALKKVGIHLSDQLPDPKPLKEYTFPDYSSTGGESLEALPAGNSDLPWVRPELSLTMVGSIKLPAIGISENIVEGTGEEMLYAVGHQPGTAFPGQPGNCVLSGHRNYLYMHPFKYLPMMKEGDEVILSAKGQKYTYVVYKTFEATPDEVWVTQPQEDQEAMLTLITCTPIPTYTKRFICWARLAET